MKLDDSELCPWVGVKRACQALSVSRAAYEDPSARLAGGDLCSDRPSVDIGSRSGGWLEEMVKCVSGIVRTDGS